ncbi:MAG: hypothetical protein PGN25_05700 [Methylorubrum populi]
MHTIRGGGHWSETPAAEQEVDARFNEIFAFDYRQARAGDEQAKVRVAHYRDDNRRRRSIGLSAVFPEPAEPIEAAAPRTADPRDAVLTAMRASNRPGRWP